MPYTLKDKANTLEEKKRKGIEELQPISNHVERARLIKWNNSKGISVVIQEQQKGHALKMIGRHIEIMGLKRYPRY